MINPPESTLPADRSIELYQPHPGDLYSLDVAARLVGTDRRSLLIYCRGGLLQPVFLPPYGIMAFTEEAICRARQVEAMRTDHGLSLAWIHTLFALVDDLAAVRAELRFVQRT